MRQLLSATAIIIAAGLATPALAQSRSPIVGLWKLDSYTVTAGGQTMKPLGDHPAGYIYYSRGGHLMIVYTGDNRPTVSGPAPSDADAPKLVATMVALAGTWKPAGRGKITVRVTSSWNQELLGADLPRDYKISGKKLEVSFAAKAPNGQDVQVVVDSERSE